MPHDLVGAPEQAPRRSHESDLTPLSRCRQRGAVGRGHIDWCYDIHATVRIVSAVHLPDLERFAVAGGWVEPELQVITGRPPPGVARDGLHPGVTISWTDDRLAVWVARPHRWAPHLLYAGVVEPLLQRLFFDRGHALVHAACASRSGRGTLVLGPPGGGKTTFVLGLAASGAGFLGDDVIVLSPGGRALAFPKHVKLAGRSPLVRRTGGWSLAIRRTVHERGGDIARRARRLGRPIAGINAIVQAIVPPPRFDCAEIDPAIEVVDSVEVASIVLLGAATRPAAQPTRKQIAARAAASTERASRDVTCDQVARSFAPPRHALARRVEALLPQCFEVVSVARSP